MSSTENITYEKEYLTKDQLNELADLFTNPFNGIDMVNNLINRWIRWLTMVLFEDIKIYPGIFNEFKEKLRKTYLSSLIEPGTGIGAITSDAIGQQATQALLNTFHSVGTAKSGGPDGIKENITLSGNRKILYSILHMKNTKMTFNEMMEMKRKFIGIDISDLLLNPEQSGESYIVNIGEEMKKNPFLDNLTPKEKDDIFNSNSSWWYSLSHFNGVYNPSNPDNKDRVCLRLRFDVQKLYNYRITTDKIAEILNKYKFSIGINKKHSDKTGGRRKLDEKSVYAVPSPTYIGIVDIFTCNTTGDDDHILINLIHTKQFKGHIISGIPGITNFYAVSTGISRIIRDITPTSRFDDKKGTWLYLESNRLLGIPYIRVLSMLDAAGIKYEMPHYNSPNSFETMFTDIPFEYHSHKNMPELRSSMKIRAYLFGNMTNHEYPSYKYTQIINGIPTVCEIKTQIDHYTYEQIGSGFDVRFYPHSKSKNREPVILSKKKFESEEVFIKFIQSLNYKITLEQFETLFDVGSGSSKSIFTTYSNNMEIIQFEIGYHTPYSPAEYDLFGNLVKPETKEFYGSFYLIYYLFQMKYIDYQINVNLDYCNSRYVTQNLDSMLNTQFIVPYNIDKQNKLQESLCQYVISDVVTIDKPERRIFLKTSMFFKDTYDFIGLPNRKLILSYLQQSNSYMSDSDKEALVLKISKEIDELIVGVDEIIENIYTYEIEYPGAGGEIKKLNANDLTKLRVDNKIRNLFVSSVVKLIKRKPYDSISSNEKDVVKMWESCISKITSQVKPKPLDRLLAFLNKKLTEDELNYVYAETSGCNFSKTITNPLVEGHRTICNHFIEVYESLGLEGMKNCQNNDLIGMINSSGYISVEYMNFLTSVTTFNGRNPMTSNGVSGQNNRDWLAMATIDSAALYVKQAANSGKEQTADATSTCLVLGKTIKTGTGYVKIVVDKTRLSVISKQSGISEKFIKLSGLQKPVDDLFMDDSDGPIYIPKLKHGKFPSSPWIYENFITRDIIFYIQQGIDQQLKCTLTFPSTVDCSSLPNLDHLLFKIPRINADIKRSF